MQVAVGSSHAPVALVGADRARPRAAAARRVGSRRTGALRLRAAIREQSPASSSPSSPATSSVDNPLSKTLRSLSPWKTAKTKYRDGVVLQGFGWGSAHTNGAWWAILKSKIPDFVEAGFTHIWLPPPSVSVDAQGYMPSSIYNLDSSYGSEGQLRALLNSLKEQGIQPVADIVLNHRCAEAQDDRGNWHQYLDDGAHPGAKVDWGNWAVTSDSNPPGTGRPKSGEFKIYAAAPNLDQENEYVRQGLKDWLLWMQNDVGFEGWRFDFVAGFAGKYIQEYVDATVGNGDETLCVGEIWPDMEYDVDYMQYNQDNHRKQIVNWLDSTGRRSCAFDFTTKGLLQEACRCNQYDRLARDGAPSGLIGWWSGRAVTFIDNHDTGSSQQHWPFPHNHVETGYAYILTHPGIPSVFWEHYFDWGDHLQHKIRSLIDIRARADIHAQSEIEIRMCEWDCYLAIIKGRAGEVAVKLGPRGDLGGNCPRSADGWKVAESGMDFCVWERPL